MNPDHEKAEKKCAACHRVPFSVILATVLIFLMAQARINGFPEDENLLDGQIVPKDFIPFSAPQNTMNLPFWGSSSNGVQIVKLAPEGKKVVASEVVATFQFRMEGAKEHLDQRLPQIKAKNQESLLNLRKAIEQLEHDLARGEIDAAKAGLDLQKKSALSKIKQRLLECDFNLLNFATKALKHRLEAARENLVVQKKYFEQQEKIWMGYFDIYNQTKSRYTIVAPQDGVLFYPLVDKLDRKVREGDRLNSGVHFLSLVRSEACELFFFLPEKVYRRVSPGSAVTVQREDGKSLKAALRSISYFPQLIGDVTKNFRVPNAWDKCFIAKADFIGSETIGTFGNVKVRIDQ